MVMWNPEEKARLLGYEVIINRSMAPGTYRVRDGRVYARSRDDLFLALELVAMRNGLRGHLAQVVGDVEARVFGDRPFEIARQHRAYLRPRNPHRITRAGRPTWR